VIDLTPEQQAQFSAGAVGVVLLIELDFSDGLKCFTSFNAPLTADGKEYLHAGDLVQVGDIKHSLETDTQTTEITLSVANQAVLAMALGNVERYRGRLARVKLQPLDHQFRLVGPAREYFSGEMEPVQIERSSPGPAGGDVGGSLRLPITRAGLSRARTQDPLRLTDAQQKADYPGDRGFEFLRDLIDKPATWVSKRFQEFQ
jgi:hypothetical protein